MDAWACSLWQKIAAASNSPPLKTNLCSVMKHLCGHSNSLRYIGYLEKLFQIRIDLNSLFEDLLTRNSGYIVSFNIRMKWNNSDTAVIEKNNFLILNVKPNKKILTILTRSPLVWFKTDSWRSQNTWTFFIFQSFKNN